MLLMVAPMTIQSMEKVATISSLAESELPQPQGSGAH